MTFQFFSLEDLILHLNAFITISTDYSLEEWASSNNNTVQNTTSEISKYNALV